MEDKPTFNPFLEIDEEVFHKICMAVVSIDQFDVKPSFLSGIRLEFKAPNGKVKIFIAPSVARDLLKKIEEVCK